MFIFCIWMSCNSCDCSWPYLFHYSLWEYHFLFMPLWGITSSLFYLLSLKYFHFQYSDHWSQTLYHDCSWEVTWLMWMWQICLLVCQIHCTLLSLLHSYFHVILSCLVCRVETCRLVLGTLYARLFWAAWMLVLCDYLGEKHNRHWSLISGLRKCGTFNEFHIYWSAEVQCLI